MTIDRYTKGVLTVIAVALLYIGAMLSGAPAAAQSGATPMNATQLVDVRPQPVVIVGWGTLAGDGRILLTTVKDRNGSVRSDPVVPVRVQQMPDSPVSVSLDVTPQKPLPVGLTAVSPGREWEPIRTRVEPAPTQRTPGPGRQ
jgi:hypothetical protein